MSVLFVYCVEMTKHILKLFHLLATHFSRFPCQTLWQNYNWTRHMQVGYENNFLDQYLALSRKRYKIWPIGTHMQSINSVATMIDIAIAIISNIV